jgi:hypothetical protein
MSWIAVIARPSSLTIVPKPGVDDGCTRHAGDIDEEGLIGFGRGITVHRNAEGIGRASSRNGLPGQRFGYVVVVGYSCTIIGGGDIECDATGEGGNREADGKVEGGGAAVAFIEGDIGNCKLWCKTRAVVLSAGGDTVALNPLFTLVRRQDGVEILCAPLCIH